MTHASFPIPARLLALVVIALAIHGPIPQLADYHAFADQASWLGIPHAGDVLSNVAFLAVGAWALATDRGRRAGTAVERRARRAFFVAVLLTAAGSTWYHWAPDDARLVWDRLPIALACAALLCAMHARCAGAQGRWILPMALAGAVASVAWWMVTADLRPYLVLQAAPLVAIPWWQWRSARPPRERIAFGIAVMLYVVAKVLELADHAVLEAIGVASGHTLKHLAAAAAAVMVVQSMRAGASR